MHGGAAEFGSNRNTKTETSLMGEFNFRRNIKFSKTDYISRREGAFRKSPFECIVCTYGERY